MELKKLSSIADVVTKIMTESAKSPEQLQEYESKNGSYVHKGTYGYAGKGAEHGETDHDKENELAKAADKPKKATRGKYGARQNYKRSTRVNEGFSTMFDALQEKGLKGLQEAIAWKSKMKKEEVDNETFSKEVEEHKAKAEGKKKGADVAKPAVQAVQSEETVAEELKGGQKKLDKNQNGKIDGEDLQILRKEETHNEIQVIDMTKADQPIETTTIDLEEKTLTEPETKKKEEVVKSMKKNLSSFKDRYGDRAKSVMYATATKIAKDKA